ncbi:MAG TPA: OpgC domain-containing protein [Bryobacteraceae bacterium]
MTSGRLPELDVLRGFLLLWMTCTHLPTRFNAYSNQFLGYVSAAEGFIFLAAFLTGRIQNRAEDRYGRQEARRNLWRRVFRIYRYHAGLLAIAFTVFALIAVRFDPPPLRNLLDFYLARPRIAIPASALLLYTPPLFDILPIYIIFMVATPGILWAARKKGWAVPVAVSACVWLLAQFGLRKWLYTAANSWGFPIPMNEGGAFDLFAWQLLWVAGLALGTTTSSRQSKARIPRQWLLLSAVFAVALFVCRHSAGALVFQGAAEPLADKWRFGIVRLLDFAALGVLLVRFGRPLGRLKCAEPLALLGRRSLEVFSAHVLICAGVLGFSHQDTPHFTFPVEVLILLGSTAVLFRVAQWASRPPRLEVAKTAIERSLARRKLA